MDWSLGNIIWMIVAGAVLGIVARFLLPGRQGIPMWTTVIAGIVGMLVGDALAGVLGVEDTAGIDWIRHFLQVLVAIVAVAVIAMLYRRRSAV